MDNKQLDDLPVTEYVSGILMDYQMNFFLLINKGGMKLKDGTTMFWQGIGGHMCKAGEQIGKPYIDPQYTAAIAKVAPILASAPDYAGVETTKIRGYDETPHYAMEREFEEETGYKLAKKHWHCYYIKTYKTTKIYFFAAFASLSTLTDVEVAAKKKGYPEGMIDRHSIVDVLFDQKQYTFDIPYLLNMIVREIRIGMFMKLDPEGVNSSGKAA